MGWLLTNAANGSVVGVGSGVGAAVATFSTTGEIRVLSLGMAAVAAVVGTAAVGVGSSPHPTNPKANIPQTAIWIKSNFCLIMLGELYTRDRDWR